VQILSDACLALFAAIGIWTLYKIIMDRLYSVSRKESVFTAIPVSGDEVDFLHRIHWVCQHTSSGGIIIIDCGLTDAGLNTIRDFMEHYNDVWFCSSEEIYTWSQGNIKWMNRIPKIK